jgi:hypothetical protein
MTSTTSTSRTMTTITATTSAEQRRVAVRFTAPGDEFERFNYGWRNLHCLPVGLLDIAHDFWRFYQLVP